MHPLRSLAKSPGFTAVAILSVALGVGSISAIYSVADAVIFRPLPFKNESSLVWLWSTRPDRPRAFFSIANFIDLKERNTTTAGLSAITPIGISVTGLGEPERVRGWNVTADLFSLLGVAAHAGRLPAATDGAPGATPTAALGYAYWQRRFGGDPSIVGKTVTLNGRPHVLTGVLPRDFVLPTWDSDIITTLSLETDPRRRDRGTSFLRGIARLKPGVSLAEAQAEFAELSARLVREHPGDNATVTAPRLLALREELIGTQRAPFSVLLAAAGGLLAILCANLAGLIAARAIDRQRDAALCSALGATPGRLLRQQLAESAVIGIIGGALGLLTCWWTMDALLALAPADLPRVAQVAIDGRVVAVAIACSILTGAGVGLVPAWRLARTPPQDVLKSRSSAVTVRSRARRTLVAAQLGLCTVLLIGTGLLVRSLRGVLSVQPGFDPGGVVTARVALTGANARSVEALNGFADEFIRRLSALPGVTSASVTSVLPLSGINTRSEFVRTDRPPANPADSSSAANRFVRENYFRTVGIPLLAGRDFTAHDDHSRRGVVIIDQALAQRDWPGEDPIGRAIRIKDGPLAREVEIIGVVGATKHFSLEEPATPAVYLPVAQMQPAQLAFLAGGMTYVARTTSEPAALHAAIRRELRVLAPDAALTPGTLREANAWTTAPRVFSLQLLGFFSGAALLLAGIGLYAVIAQSVAARTREFGIRLTLGADAARLLRHVLADAGWLVLAGVASGLVLAAAVSPLVARLLYGVPPIDVATYATVAALIGALGLFACWLPARRAARTDPIVALRAE